MTQVSRRAQGRSQPFPEGFVVFLNLAATHGLSEGQEVAYPAESATPYRYKYASGATGVSAPIGSSGNRHASGW